MLRKKGLQASDQSSDQSDDDSRASLVAFSETDMWSYTAQLGASGGGGAAGPQASHQASQSTMPSDKGDTRAGAGTQAAAVSMMALTDVTSNGAPSPNFTPGDDLFGNQWHLLNTGQFGGTPGIDLNVTRAWDDYTGAGVHVGIYDSGVQYTHHDLDDNYDSALSVIVDGSPHDPAPDLTVVDNAHGTNVAGLIAAENDGTGTVGVAFDASITGINIFVLSDAQFLQAWDQMTNFDVTNNSWGYTNAFADSQLAPAGSFFNSFFADINNAVQSGRGGLGTIIVHSAGNDRTNNFNSGEARDANDSNFTNSREIISVAALDNQGFITQYSTPGAPVFVSGFGGGIDTPGIWSTDFLGNQGFNRGPGDGFTGDDSNLDYDGVMDGTSAAGPEVAGVVALILQANPNLGWRDVQEILAISARHTGSAIGTAPTGWELYNQGFNHALDWNGGGLHFDNDYGFGLVDATAAVRLAETWTQQSTSSNEFVITTGHQALTLAVPDDSPAGVSFLVNAPDINVEHLELELDWSPNHPFLGDLVITVTSPTGTVSTLLNREGTAFGSSQFGLDQTLPNWVFTSNAFRDESGQTGANRWTVTISDNAAGDTGTITNVDFSLFGSAPSADDTYYYTNEYGTYAGTFGHSTVLSDPDGGTNTINAAAVSSSSTINLNTGVGSIAGQPFSIAAGTTIQIAFGGDGNDTLTANSAGDQLHGERGNDTIVGGDGNDFVDGGDGNDTLSDGQGTDVVLGGNGDDHLVPTDFSPSHHDIWDGGPGIDTWDASAVVFVPGVVIDLAAHNWTFAGDAASINNVENVEGSQGGETIVGDQNANVLDGNGGDDVIDGGDGNDTLNGGLGDDVLNGGAGADNMVGGAGDDTYVVDNALDTVFESVGGGTDTVVASVNYALQAGQEVEYLRASATGLVLTGNEFNNTIVGLTGNDTLNGGIGNDSLNGGDGNDTLNGGAGNDGLIGGNGNDVLNGQAGADFMAGGAGDDTYLVDNALDTVFESVGGGTDTVVASVNYALQAGQEVEYLRASATGLVLTGNEFNNTIVGLTGNDTLNGGIGNDSLNGGDGNDTLNGGAGNDGLIGGNGNDVLNGQAGADFMAGGAGDDTYLVDNALDTVFESVGGGTDTVVASVNYALQAGQEVEYLRASATGLVLTGNEFNNTIVGLTGNDTLNGGIGNDSLNGGDGNDTLNGGAGNDGLIGGNGNDVLNGQAGADFMAGGAGDDTYLVDNALDTVFESVGGGTDTVVASVNYALQAGQEVEYLRASATGLVLTGNEFNNTIVGLTGNDTLNGGIGNDSLNGGDGNDTLNGGAGNDGLIGGNGNDVLNGQAGADFMAGGAGDDTYLVDNALDTVFESVGGGTDTVFASVNYALQAGQEVEFLRANAGATGLLLTGNEFNNTIVGLTGNDTLNGGIGNDSLNGGDGNDTLNGGAGNDGLIGGNGNDVLNGQAGADFMAGGAGDDTYLVDNALDTVFESVGGGTDTVFASVNYALQAGQEVEFLRADAGATGLLLTGNEFNNLLVGLTGDDTLNGGNGNDTLNGGDGNDTLNGGNGNDTLTGGNGNDVLSGLFGIDLMAGGAGNDTFAWNASTEGGDNITDFISGTDVLQFNAAAFGFAPGHVLVNGTEFIANNSPVANTGGPTFLMNNAGHNLSYDADGTGGGAAVLIAHMNANAAASDLHFVV